MRVAAFDHVHLYAADPAATRAFYQRHFGAELVGRTTSAHGDGNDFLLLGGQLLVVSPFPPGLAPAAPPPAGDGAVAAGFGVAHVGINVDDVDAAVRELDAAGVAVLSPVRQGGMIRYAYVQAPDGVVLELTAYRVTGALRAALPVLAGYNRLVHAARRALVKAALPAP
ncbi:MAG: VOC family protein [Kofleriaceae bacterium]|nr:VOC family protein [Kofleriaceae bacterium]